VARHKLTTNTNTTTAATYNTTLIAPGTGRLVLAFVANIRGGGAAAIPTAVGNGLTWDQVASIQPAGAANHRLTCFRAMGAAPKIEPLTFDFGGQSQAACAWTIFEYDAVDLTGVDGAGAALQEVTNSGTGTSLTILLGPLTDPAQSTVVGGILLATNNPVNPGAGLAQIDQQAIVKGGDRGTLQTEDRIGGGQTVDWSWSGGAGAAAIAIEVKAAAVVTPTPTPTASGDAETLALARRFEPVLVFHPEERFFPSDAKRYVEACALWKAEAPFDVKDSWGGKGAPFDRAPVIDAGNIAALAGEPGTLLGPANLVDSATEERFFDLAGWKDAAGTPQPKVTATTRNTYSNREAVASLYNNPDNHGGNQKLRESRFWYHAELFEHDRLRRLLATVPAPDLVRVLDSLSNAALLNYYFFYPAHEEPLAPVCDNIEGLEFGSFVGEWAGLSVLLERDDPTAAFWPSFIGFSGRLPAVPGQIHPTPTASPSDVGQAADDDDPAKRLVVKVSPFGRAKRNGEHPQLFVAKGTHSLYLEPGSHETTYPWESAPGACGRFEPEPEIPEYDDPSAPAAVGIFYAKVIAGAEWGALLGAVVGGVWGIAEFVEGLDDERDDPGYFEKWITHAAPDETVLPGSGKVVKPEGLTVPDAGADVHDWQAAQTVAIDGRRYDFIVDRTRQTWWPGESGQGGYRGRWGPRVEADPFGRRAGMRFPAFWRMFFLAFADGRARTLF
jgi:hypothetical protein